MENIREEKPNENLIQNLEQTPKEALLEKALVLPVKVSGKNNLGNAPTYSALES